MHPGMIGRVRMQPPTCLACHHHSLPLSTRPLLVCRVGRSQGRKARRRMIRISTSHFGPPSSRGLMEVDGRIRNSRVRVKMAAHLMRSDRTCRASLLLKQLRKVSLLKTRYALKCPSHSHSLLHNHPLSPPPSTSSLSPKLMPVRIPLGRLLPPFNITFPPNRLLQPLSLLQRLQLPI